MLYFHSVRLALFLCLTSFNSLLPMNYWCVLFSFPIFGDFSITFLLLISSSIHCGQSTLYNFYFFKLVEVLPVAQGMIYIGIYSVDTWEKYVFCCCWTSADGYWVLLFPCWCSFQLFSCCWVRSVEISNYNYKFENFPLSLSVLICTFFILLSVAYTCRICSFLGIFTPLSLYNIQLSSGN